MRNSLLNLYCNNFIRTHVIWRRLDFSSFIIESLDLVSNIASYSCKSLFLLLFQSHGAKFRQKDLEKMCLQIQNNSPLCVILLGGMGNKAGISPFGRLAGLSQPPRGSLVRDINISSIPTICKYSLMDPSSLGNYKPTYNLLSTILCTVYYQ